MISGIRLIFCLAGEKKPAQYQNQQLKIQSLLTTRSFLYKNNFIRTMSLDFGLKLGTFYEECPCALFFLTFDFDLSFL